MASITYVAAPAEHEPRYQRLLHGLDERDQLEFSTISAPLTEGDPVLKRQSMVYLFSPWLTAPLREARLVHQAAPNAQLLFLREGDDERLQRELRIAPRIGSHWSIVQAGDETAIARSIESSIRASSTRRQLRTTLDRMNLSLSTGPDAARMRQLAISDRYLASILAQASDAIISSDLDGKIRTFNRAAEEMFGRSDLKGKTLMELLFGEAARKVERVLRELTTGTPERVEVATTRSDGSEIEIELSLSLITEAEVKRPIGVSIIGRDVSARLQTERSLAFLADVSELLASSLDPVLTLQRVAELTVRTQADYCVVDLARDQGVEKVALAARDPRRPELLDTLRNRYAPRREGKHPYTTAVNQGKVVRVNEPDESFWRTATRGEEHYEIVQELGFHSILTAPLMARGSTLGAVSLIRRRESGGFSDHEMEMAAELGRRMAISVENALFYQEAERANRAKDEFLATLSHELRTPMTSILGWARLMEVGDLDDESLREGIAAIRKSAEAQAQLIDDILDVSRITLGKLRLEVGEIDLVEIVQEAIATVQHAATVRQITIETDLEPELMLVSGDSRRLQQVVWNLLSNAVKFTPRSGRVSVKLDRVASRARLAVSDTGEGIPREFLPHVFDQFKQLDSSTTRSVGGLGLGLAIVRHIVELHGGDVAAESEGKGRGATFTVTLPLKAVRENAQPAERLRSDYRVPGNVLPDLSRVTVLVVDDEQPARRLISKVLEESGAEVRSCATVSEAIEMFKRQPVDLVISDIAMPGEDGFSFIRQLLQIERIMGCSVPALALTAFGRVDDRIRILEAGFDRYLMKPIDPVELANMVAELTIPHRRQPS
jgi:PAS domain S-box-containing protein